MTAETGSQGPEHIGANTILPAIREPLRLTTSDGLTLVGELALPSLDDGRTPAPIAATLVCVHPLPTHGGMMDSHLLRKAAWRLPALAGIAVLRFNTRGTTSAEGTSEGAFDEGRAEGLDLQAAYAEAQRRRLPNIWLLGWSFGSDVVLQHALDLTPAPAGALLLSPPLRTTTSEQLARWDATAPSLRALVPEDDDFLPPGPARERFAVTPTTQIAVGDGFAHLWVGEPAVRFVFDEIVRAVAPGVATPLPDSYAGPIRRYSPHG